MVLWLAYGGVGYLALTYGLLRTPQAGRSLEGGAMRLSPGMALIPLLFFVNGLGPYVGFRTENSFAMYSNLATEGGASNHYVVRETLDPWGYLRPVTVIGSNVKSLEWSVRQETNVTWLFLWSQLTTHDDGWAEYEVEGVRHRFEPGDTPELEPALWLRKLAPTRRMPRGHGPRRCGH